MNRRLSWLLLLICGVVAGCTAVTQQSTLMTDAAETARESPLTLVESYVAVHPPALQETTSYTSTEAAFVLTLPNMWSDHYGVVEVSGEDAAALYPKAQHVTTFVYVPAATDLPVQPLLAIYLFSQRDWEAVDDEVTDTLGRIVAETETQVYVAAMPAANGYPEDSEDAALFDRMLLSNQEVRDLIRVGDLTARTDGDELSAVRWVWRETLISDGSVTVPPAVVGVATQNEPAYTLEFGADGLVQFQAGCQVGVASYSARSGRMQIDVGEMESNGCIPDSVDDDYVTWLSQAAGFFYSDDELVIVLAMDSGSMFFSRVQS